MILVIIILVIILFSNNFILRKHVDIKGQKKGNENTKCIYDIGHAYLPKLNVDQTSRNLGNLMAGLPVVYTLLFLPTNILRKQFFKDLCILYLIRLILSNLTILPSIEKCKLDSSLLTLGGCCDYLFSGHTSSALLSSIYIIFYIKPKSIIYILIYNILNSLLIIMHRYHYTDDVILAWFMTIFIFSLHHKKGTLDIIKTLFVLN